MTINEQEVVHPLGLVVPPGISVAGAIVANGPAVLVIGETRLDQPRVNPPVGNGRIVVVIKYENTHRGFLDRGGRTPLGSTVLSWLPCIPEKTCGDPFGHGVFTPGSLSFVELRAFVDLNPSVLPIRTIRRH